MEEQFILRVPPSVAERIERLLNENASSSEDKSLDLSFSDDGRSGTFSIGNDQFPASLLDLPGIVESYKTYDDSVLIKSADIGQMIMVGEEGDSAPDTVEYRHGLTPPMRDARRRRFRREPDLNNVYGLQGLQQNEDSIELFSLSLSLSLSLYIYIYFIYDFYWGAVGCMFVAIAQFTNPKCLWFCGQRRDALQYLVFSCGTNTILLRTLMIFVFYTLQPELVKRVEKDLLKIMAGGTTDVEVVEQDEGGRNTSKKAAPVPAPKPDLSEAGNAEEPERSDSDESG